MKELDLIGVQMDLGASKRGVAMGPMAIRYGGLREGLEALGFAVHDRGDIVPPEEGESRPNLRYYDQVVEVNGRLYRAVRDSLERGHFPVCLGGDHSIAAGSIAAAAEHYAEKGGIGVIWIDAHGDWNNEHSTHTGNMHGMPFSAVCGHGPDGMASFGERPVWVDPRHCVQIGGAHPHERGRHHGISH